MIIIKKTDIGARLSFKLDSFLVNRILVAAIIDNKIETKGDHNQDQLVRSNNIFRTDETEISESQVIGKVILKIPYLGWVKIFFVELLSKFR